VGAGPNVGTGPGTPNICPSVTKRYPRALYEAMIAGRMSADIARFMCMRTIEPFQPRSAAQVMKPGSLMRESLLSTAQSTTALYPASFAAWITLSS
jgi:hypothetical protein